VLLAACATANGPGERATGFGYTEIELSRGIYQVRLQPPQDPTIREVWKYAQEPAGRHGIRLLLSCAKSTLEHGSRYFIVERFGKGEAHYRLDLDGQFWLWERTDRHTVLIKIFDERPSGNTLLVYDAAALQGAIHERYQMD
jgi:hypothetical protein